MRAAEYEPLNAQNLQQVLRDTKTKEKGREAPDGAFRSFVSFNVGFNVSFYINYYVSYYISFYDFSAYAVRNISAYVSDHTLTRM